MPAHRSLRDLLLEEGLADASTVETGERTARRLGCSFAAALLEERLIEPGELLELLRRRLKLPEVDLDRIVVEPEAVQEVPLTLAEHHRLLPLGLERRGGRPVIRVAMADPLDAAAIEEVEFTSGCRVEPVLALATDIAAAVKRHYHGVVTKVMREAPAHEEPALAPSPHPAEPEPARRPTLHTQPAHRLEDEAPPEMRVRALLNVLISRGLLSEEDYLEELSVLLSLRSGRDE
ncbi:MAG TPA: hypothetical protein VGQ83_18050 [Polyangia bacterium]|jgi:hypothetical protein